MKIGFVGLGIMGAPMARNLIASGHELHLHSRSGVPDDLKASGRVWSTSEEVARNAEIIITMLPDTPDVEKVLLGDNGICAGLTPGKLVIDMSSISPVATRTLAAAVKELQCDYLDAPVSGGETGARQATLSIMVGGAVSAFERALPVLRAMGKTIVHVGQENGDGQVAKCANQIVVGLTIQAVAEGLLFAKRAGADLEKIRQVLLGGLASSRILDSHGRRMIDRTFAPGFRIRLHQKDLGNVLASAHALDLDLPATTLLQTTFSEASAAGAEDLDHSALILGLEHIQ